MKCSTIFGMLQLKIDVKFFDFLANGLIQRVTSDSISKMSEVISVTYLRTSSGICSISLRRFLNSQGLGWGVLVTIGKGTVVCSVVSVVAAASVVVVVAAAAVGASVSVVTTASVVVVGGLVGASVSVVTTASVAVVGAAVGALVVAAAAVDGSTVGASVVVAGATVEGLTVGASVIAAAAVEGSTAADSAVNESKSFARFLNPFQIWFWWTFTSASWSLTSGRALAWKYK